MKSLSQFETVKAALSQITAEVDVSNGTSGIKFLAHYWSRETVYDKASAEIKLKIAQLMFANKTEGVKELQDQLLTLPKPKVIMVWKLLQPIPVLNGTKTITDGDKTYKLQMNNVKFLYIPEDAVEFDLLDYEETTEILKDQLGNDAIVVNMHLKRGLIDIAPPKADQFDKELVPKRAMVTPISFKSMQVAGQMLSKERLAKKRRYGFDEQQ